MTDDLDDLESMLGMDFKPATHEEDFFAYLTQGSNPRINETVYGMNHALHIIMDLQASHNVNMTVNVASSGGILARKVTMTELVRHTLEYYLLMRYGTRFTEDLSHWPKIDLTKTVDLLMAHDSIKKLINKSYD